MTLNIMTVGMPQWKQTRGRPIKRWRDFVEKDWTDENNGGLKANDEEPLFLEEVSSYLVIITKF